MKPRDYEKGEIICVDKPLHWTSFDTVKRVRGELCRRLGVKKFKVGHAGTLDPLATGVMIICTGKATKNIDKLQAGNKEYIATLQLGATTPSFDLETDIDATFPITHITRELIENVLPRFVGTIQQIPPAFSACKIDGKRAYKMARKGQDVTLKPKELQIEKLEIIDFTNDGKLTIRVMCSKGTYIRALARDIGEALNSGAHLISLKRTKVGNVSIENCLSIEDAVKAIREDEITTQQN